MALDSQVREAMDQALAAGETTADGRPLVEALEKRLGRGVTADQRDEWWGQRAEQETDEQKTEAEPAPAEPEAAPLRGPEPKPGGPVMWVGPTLNKPIHVRRNTIFRAGVLPRDLAGLLAEHKELEALVVPVALYPIARRDLAVASSPLGRAAKAAAELAQRAK